MADLASPKAARLAVPRWLEPRLAVGVLLVLLAVVAGARVFASADRYSRVYVARHALTPGEHLVADDVGVGRVRLQAQAGLYLAAGRPPVGYVVTRYVGARELVPLAALAATAPSTSSRLVTVPVQPGHLPPDLGHGDLVDVYLTPKSPSGSAVSPPILVLAGVPVQAKEGGSRSFAGDATLAVVLAVPAGRVADLVHAVESGLLDLVALPASATAAAEPAGRP